MRHLLSLKEKRQLINARLGLSPSDDEHAFYDRLLEVVPNYPDMMQEIEERVQTAYNANDIKRIAEKYGLQDYKTVLATATLWQ